MSILCIYIYIVQCVCIYIYTYICTYTVYIYTVVCIYIYIIYTMFTVPFLYLHRSFSHRKFHVSGPSTWPISLAASAAFFSWSWWQSEDATNWVDVKYKCQYLIWNICGEYIYDKYIWWIYIRWISIYVPGSGTPPSPPMVMVPPSPPVDVGVGWMNICIYVYICIHVYM